MLACSLLGGCDGAADRSNGTPVHGELQTGELQIGELQIAAPRMRAPVPGMDKTVAYVNLQNRGQVPVVITSANSESVRAIEFHITREEAGMMRMRRMAQIEVAPGETVRLEPGGLHLMLFGVKQPLPKRVDVHFEIEGQEGGSVPFVVHPFDAPM